MEKTWAWLGWAGLGWAGLGWAGRTAAGRSIWVSPHAYWRHQPSAATSQCRDSVTNNCFKQFNPSKPAEYGLVVTVLSATAFKQFNPASKPASKPAEYGVI